MLIILSSKDLQIDGQMTQNVWETTKLEIPPKKIGKSDPY